MYVKNIAFLKLFALLFNLSSCTLVIHSFIVEFQELLKLAPFFKNVKIFGPAPAPIYFLRGRFRRRFLIKSDKNVNIQDVILNWTRKINTPNHIKLTIDIDPFSFM